MVWFNAGSTTAANKDIAMIFVNTNLAAAAYAIFKIIDMTIGLRVSKEEELEGLDATEHGGNAYPDFTTINHGSMGVTSRPGDLVRSPEPFASKELISPV
jgi:ammonia channel protein AmtB